MSIKLRFEKGSLITQVVLKDEAFAGLLDLISNHQSDEAPTPGPLSATPPQSSAQPISGDPSADAKAWLSEHTAPEVLNLFGWGSNPEKILLLGALHEAHSGSDDAWRSADMETRFSEAREGFPANFPRDIRAAIREGLIATVTPRTYRVSRTGWNRISDALTNLQV